MEVIKKMIAIGNGEKCPFCNLMCIDFLIDGDDTIVHLTKKHMKDFLKEI